MSFDKSYEIFFTKHTEQSRYLVTSLCSNIGSG